MIRLGMVCAAGLLLAGCNAAGDVDLSMSAYTTCLDRSVGQNARVRQAVVQRAFNACKAQEQALLAASTRSIGAADAAKAVADGKAAYSRRMVAGRR